MPSASAGAGWQAIGTSVVLRVLDPAGVAAARIAVEHELAAIDLACSRFRADSELSRLNAEAGRSRKVSPLLVEALEVALRGAELTDGDVDPTLGRALELAGYDRDWELLDPPVEDGARPRPRITARRRSGWRSVTLDRDSLAVHVPAGISLDLGATAKAWAADRAATAAASAASCPVLVGIGGDISTAGGGAPPGGWQIHVTDDHRSSSSAEGQAISISSGGLATSSTAVRRWRHAGHTMHHIIDPATELPVTDTWRTVSVAAATCTDANIATTAALVRGPAAPAWLQSLGLPARLIDWDGHMTTLGGWPEESSGASAYEARRPTTA
jgi:thiamine biosynthesis lipoprotein